MRTVLHQVRVDESRNLDRDLTNSMYSNVPNDRSGLKVNTVLCLMRVGESSVFDNDVPKSMHCFVHP